jgi:hypothetical protein
MSERLSLEMIILFREECHEFLRSYARLRPLSVEEWRAGAGGVRRYGNAASLGFSEVRYVSGVLKRMGKCVSCW